MNMKSFYNEHKKAHLIQRALRRLETKYPLVIPGRARFDADTIAHEVIADENFDFIAQPKTVAGWVRRAADLGYIAKAKHGRSTLYFRKGND